MEMTTKGLRITISDEGGKFFIHDYSQDKILLEGEGKVSLTLDEFKEIFEKMITHMENPSE